MLPTFRSPQTRLNIPCPHPLFFHNPPPSWPAACPPASPPCPAAPWLRAAPAAWAPPATCDWGPKKGETATLDEKKHSGCNPSPLLPCSRFLAVAWKPRSATDSWNFLSAFLWVTTFRKFEFVFSISEGRKQIYPSGEWATKKNWTKSCFIRKGTAP